VTAPGFVRKLVAHWQFNPPWAKPTRTKKKPVTQVQAIALIAAVMALFCLVYLLTFWLHGN
jgi:hypothetical protein